MAILIGVRSDGIQPREEEEEDTSAQRISPDRLPSKVSERGKWMKMYSQMHWQSKRDRKGEWWEIQDEDERWVASTDSLVAGWEVEITLWEVESERKTHWNELELLLMLKEKAQEGIVGVEAKIVVCQLIL